MIRLTTDNGQVAVEQFAFSPTWFLDTLVWCEVGADKNFGGELAAYLGARGATLVYTAPLLIELGRIQNPAQQQRIRAFADQLPFAFFDSNPFEVERRARAGALAPQFSFPLIQQVALSAEDASRITLRELLDDVFHPTHFEHLNRRHASVLEPFLGMLQRARRDPRAARERQRVRRRTQSLPLHPVPTLVMEAALNFPGSNPMNIGTSDAWDVAMFAVPACYCTVTVLDRRWRDFFAREFGWLGRVGRVLNLKELRREMMDPVRLERTTPSV